MQSLFLLSALLSVTEPEAALLIDKPIVDRGEVKAGQFLQQTFKLTNQGKRVLNITELQAGCGCLQPKLSNRVLLPGESVELQMEVHTLSQQEGPNSWKVNVRYKVDPVNPCVEVPEEEQIVKIKANLVKEIVVEPATLTILARSSVIHQITLTDRRAKPLSITGIRCPSKHIVAELLKSSTNKAGQMVQPISMMIAEDCPTGHFTGTICIDTDDPDYKEIRIPFQLVKRSNKEVQATPDELVLRLANNQTTTSGLIRLRDAEDKPVKVEKIETDVGVIQTKTASGPGNMATVRIGVDLSQDRNNGQGVVKVHLSEPNQQVLVIPVRWQVK